MLSIFGKKSSDELVGLELLPDGIAFVHRSLIEGEIVVNDMSYLTYDQNNSGGILADHVKKLNLKNTPCTVVLNPDSYQIVLVEAPQVPEEEIKDAVRWKLKDLISIPVENAAFDIFYLPKDGTNSSKQMLYVVVADKHKLEEISKKIGSSGLNLKYIDISEFALRNIAVKLREGEELDRGLAITRVREGNGSIALYKNGNLYLSRQFELDYPGGLLDDLPVENLSLQIQRSLDYYERQMGQTMPNAIYVCGENVTEDKITPTLRSSLATAPDFLDIRSAVKLNQEFDDMVMQVCLGAVGGSMRVEA